MSGHEDRDKHKCFEGLQEIMHQAAVSAQMHSAVAWLRAALQLSASEEKQRAEVDSCMEVTYNQLKAELDQCRHLIAALRWQIKETKEALELDDPKLQDMMAKVQAETADLHQQLPARVKLSADPPSEARGGRVRLGGGVPPRGVAASGGKLGVPGLKFEAIDVDGDGMLSKDELQSKMRNMGWSFEEAGQTFAVMDRDADGGISASEFAAFCQMEDKNLEVGTLSGIAKLRQKLAVMQKAHAPKPVEMVLKLGLDFRCVLYKTISTLENSFYRMCSL